MTVKKTKTVKELMDSPRKKMEPLLGKISKEHREFTRDLALLEQRAFEMKLPQTARKINSATQEIGWEIARQKDKEATKDMTPEERSKYLKGQWA